MFSSISLKIAELSPINLKDNECRKKYKFHDVGKEHLVTVKLSRNYQKPWAKKVDKWTK